MAKREREKGATGEREVVRIAKEHGLSAQRTAPLQAGRLDHADVVIGCVDFEVKRCETTRVNLWLTKAKRIVFRKSNEEWRVIIPLTEYLELRAELLEAVDPYA